MSPGRRRDGFPFLNRRLLGSPAWFFRLADTPMLIVCPNCASSYGVDMASLRPAGGSARKVRCSRCGLVWQAELSYAEKLMVAADAVLPVRRAMLAAAQAAAEAARSTLPRLRRPTTILAEELAAAGVRANPPPVAATDRKRPAWPSSWRPSSLLSCLLTRLLTWRP